MKKFLQYFHQNTFPFYNLFRYLELFWAINVDLFFEFLKQTRDYILLTLKYPKPHFIFHNLKTSHKATPYIKNNCKK